MSTSNESQTYVSYLLAEHRRLHRMLLQARQTIASAGDASRTNWKDNLLKLFRDLRSELQCHFSQEEEGGCLDRAVSFQPHLSLELKQVEQEHPRLLGAIDRLIAQTQDCQCTPADLVALQTEFEDLCRDLQAHEAAENKILSQGFGEEIES